MFTYAGEELVKCPLYNNLFGHHTYDLWTHDRLTMIRFVRVTFWLSSLSKNTSLMKHMFNHTAV